MLPVKDVICDMSAVPVPSITKETSARLVRLGLLTWPPCVARRPRMIAALVGDQVGQCWEIDDASSALRRIRVVPPLSEVRPASATSPPDRAVDLCRRPVPAAVDGPLPCGDIGQSQHTASTDASRVVE